LHNPFTNDFELRNIITGGEANENVNVDEYEDVGKKIIDKMIG